MSFILNGVRFHLNENVPPREFEGRYRLLFWHDGYKRWQQCGVTVDDREEAIGWAIRNFNFL